MDELMAIDLPHDHIAAVHVCACNPRRLAHYPEDWKPENCAHSSVPHPTAPPPIATANSPRPYSQLNSGTVILNPSKILAASITRFLYTSEKSSEWSFPDQDLLSEFFKGKWRPIPWYFNALRTLHSVHPQLWRNNEIRFLHYILADKPWHSRITPPGSGQGFDVMNRWWWECFDALGKTMERMDPEGWKLVLSTVDNSH
jgi:lipopolysaccharide biosynthesis glycosyltransferase